MFLVCSGGWVIMGFFVSFVLFCFFVYWGVCLFCLCVCWAVCLFVGVFVCLFFIDLS